MIVYFSLPVTTGLINGPSPAKACAKHVTRAQKYKCRMRQAGVSVHRRSRWEEEESHRLSG